MTWVRLDENIPHHPKFLSISPTAAWLFICGLTYCNRFLTDGAIPSSALPSLMPTGYHLDRYVIELTSAGLWDKIEPRSDGDRDKIETGFTVHDYLDYQPSAETIRAQRAATAARVAAHRNRRNASVTPLQPDGNAVTPTTCNAPPVRSGPVRIDPVEQDLPAGSRPAPRKRGAKVDAPAKDSEVTAAVKFWAALFQERRGSEPVIAWPRACGQMVKIVRAVGLDETKRLLTAMFDDGSKFVADSDHGIGFFVASVNRWRGNGQPPAAKPARPYGINTGPPPTPKDQLIDVHNLDQYRKARP